MDTQGIVLKLAILTIYTVTLSQQANHLMKVEECPSSGTEWKKGTRDFNCTDNKTYHCLPYVQPDKTAKKEFYEGCILFENVMSTSTGSCPQVRDVDSDFAFENEKFMCTFSPDSCPPMDVKYRSDELYRYPGCLGRNETYIDESETTAYIYSTTFKPQSSPAGLSVGAIAGIVVGVIIGIVLVVVIGYIFKKSRSSTRRSNQGNERNHVNGDAAHLKPFLNPTSQGSNLQEGEDMVDADVGHEDDVQPDTPQPTETPAGQGQQPSTSVHITNIINKNYYNVTDYSKNNTTNIGNAGNVQMGKKSTLNNISSENADSPCVML